MMKTSVMIGLAGVVLATSGCRDRSDARIAALETQVAELQTKQRVLENHYDRALAGLNQNILELRTNDVLAMNAQQQQVQLSGEMTELLKDFQKRLDRHADRLFPTNAARSTVAAPAGATRPATLIDGIPASVHSQITAEARKNWPGDYRMQAHEVEKQVAAWKKINASR